MVTTNAVTLDNKSYPSLQNLTWAVGIGQDGKKMICQI